MRSFKKPLKAEEERYYLKMYRDGDEKAKEKLIEHNLRLVAHIVKKYNSPDRDLDDSDFHRHDRIDQGSKYI